MSSRSRWYVLRSKPRKERILSRFAISQGYDIFYPTISVNPVNPRAARARPYFPGYMFVRVALSQVGDSTFHWMPFSQGLVHVGGEPARVSESFVSALHRRVDEIREFGGLESADFVKGDQVSIRKGVFEGYKAIFDTRLPGVERVRVLLGLLSDRYVSMEIDVGLIEQLAA